MHGSVRKRPAMLAAAFGAVALLGGPAASLALDTGQTATSLVTSSTTKTASGVSSKPVSARRTTQHRSISRVTTRSTRSSPPAPVSATVQGTNPHGQGTVLAVSLGGKEAVVVGRSRGEQRSDGTYHGHTTTLALFGNDVIANDTGPGETKQGPIAPIQDQVLDPICKGSGGNVCLEALRADSSTTTTGSTNHSRLAGASLGGANGINAVVGDSQGNIQGDGDCQNAFGSVILLHLMIGGNPVLDIGQSASDSKSCPSGTTVTNSSQPLVAIGGQQVPLPGCGANQPGNLLDLSPLLTIACNAGAATGSNGIVNDALAGTILPGANGPAGTLSGAGTGASAQAPSGPMVLGVRQTSPKKNGNGASSTNQSGGGKGKNKGHGNGNNGPGAPAAANKTQPLSAKAAGKLPYTGTDVVLFLFIGSLLLAAGLALREPLRRGTARR